MATPLRIGLAGLGTVGGGVGKQLEAEAARLAAICGREITVTAICARDRSKDRGFDVSDAIWFDDPVEMAKNAEIDVFVELIGGSDGSAKSAVEAALSLRQACGNGQQGVGRSSWGGPGGIGRKRQRRTQF